jgi:hypothetical protein
MFEIVGNVKVLQPKQEGELAVEFDTLYHGNSPFRITIATSVYLNWPKEKMLTVPVSLQVCLEYLSGRVSIILFFLFYPLYFIGIICGSTRIKSLLYIIIYTRSNYKFYSEFCSGKQNEFKEYTKGFTIFCIETSEFYNS